MDSGSKRLPLGGFPVAALKWWAQIPSEQSDA
jgi:hypothetical protein